MWYFEVLWEDAEGDIHGSSNTNGLRTQWEAQREFELNEDDILEQINAAGGVKIVDVQIVYRDEHAGFSNGTSY